MRHYRPLMSLIPHRPPVRRRGAGALVGAVLGIGLLAGCSASTTASSGADSAQLPAAAGGAQARQSASGAGGEAAAAVDAGGTATGVATQAELQRKLTRKADLSLTVADVPQAAARVRSVTTAADGIVLSESITRDPTATGPGPDPAHPFSTMTISVPSSALDTTLDRLSELGTVASRSTSSEDVTAHYVDTASRIATMRASIDRVRALMSKATKIGDIVSLESELSRREADLESLQAQLNALDNAVAMSPVTITLSTTAPTPAPPRSGFLGGLQAGWDAFVTSGTWLLTAFGALLPFGVVLAVVLVPLWVWLRRHRTSPPSAPSVAGTPGPPSAPPAQA